MIQLSSPPIFLSHDWPQSIEQHGDLQNLLNRKPFFRQDIANGQLGSPPLMGLLRTLKPQWWFSAHLHVRFQARVVHDVGLGSSEEAAAPVPAAVPNPDEIVIEDDDDDENGGSAQANADDPPPAMATTALPRNSDEIVLSDEEDEVAVPPPPPPPPSETKFLALDKCLPKRQFLEVSDRSIELIPDPLIHHFIQIVDVLAPDAAPTSSATPRLTYDPEWLAITRAFHPYLSTERTQAQYPDESTARLMIQKELEWVKSNVKNKSANVATGMRDVDDCQPFVMTAPGPGGEGGAIGQQREFSVFRPKVFLCCPLLFFSSQIYRLRI